jgi:aspartokinase
VRSLPSALPYGFLARVFDVLARHELAVDLVATSHSSTVFIADRNEDLVAVTEELSEFAKWKFGTGSRP